ncbi:hypothetical protein GCM10010205_27250 [Streptomyces nojiriensis]|nr:hypothetical protein GCM10010205_27250 [Streptomyces nojiriensis]
MPKRLLRISYRPVKLAVQSGGAEERVGWLTPGPPAATPGAIPAEGPVRAVVAEMWPECARECLVRGLTYRFALP